MKIPWRFWTSLAMRTAWMGSAFICLVAALKEWPMSWLVWLGAGCGFVAMAINERRKQVKRGELED